MGLNYKHSKNLLLRSGVRWGRAVPLGGANWVDGDGNPANRPFNDFTQRQQFLWDMDLIALF